MTNPEADIETAACLLGLEPKWLQPFSSGDPFHEEQLVEGFLSLKPDHRYGALAILRVAEQPAPQVVAATPKLHYPFDKAGTFCFPPIRRIVFYEKLDGTNVLAYSYRNASGQPFLSYKLRLSPFLRNGRWGNFLDMWHELLSRYPAMANLAGLNNCHVSFEMFGRRNAHLIDYEVPLDAAVLFGVGADWQVVPPYKLDTQGVPAARVLGELAAAQDPVQTYNDLRADMEHGNKATEDSHIVGLEGAVWYVEGHDRGVSLWKCKPESVEAIHWATGINKAAVLATCRNLLETQDVLNLDTLRPLLLEEYSEEEIDGYVSVIEDCIRVVVAENAFIGRVMEAYSRLGLSIHTHKGDVMRALSQHFERSDMKRVFSTVSARAPGP